jgi:hypothetical protein
MKITKLMEEFQFKGTPGPWYYQEGADAYTHIVRYDSGKFMCQLSQNSTGISKANAMLIAAAPLLLSTLIKAVRHQDRLKNAADFMVKNKLHTKPYSFPDWYNEAKAAIAAAGVTVKPVTDDQA